MPRYMVQFSYTADAWAALVKSPEDRRAAVESLFSKVGGKMLELYYCFGDYDGIIIGEAPDNQACTAAVLAALTPGHVKSIKTTVLMSVPETVEAMRKAGTIAYPGPTGMR